MPAPVAACEPGACVSVTAECHGRPPIALVLPYVEGDVGGMF